MRSFILNLLHVYGPATSNGSSEKKIEKEIPAYLRLAQIVLREYYLNEVSPIGTSYFYITGKPNSRAITLF